MVGYHEVFDTWELREQAVPELPTVAIIGASSDPSKFGNRAVRAFARKGYTVYPVHPRAAEIEGLRAYPSIKEVPLDRLDRVSFYVPPEVGLTIIDDVAAKTVGEVWFNPGSDSPALIARAESLGLNVVVACSLVNIGAM